jgi:hypothetical protein
MSLEHFDAAEPLLKEALDIAAKTHDEETFYTAFYRGDWGYAMAMRGEATAGDRELSRSIDTLRRLSPVDADLIARMLEKRVRIALRYARSEGALALVDEMQVASTGERERAEYWVGRADCLRGEVYIALAQAQAALENLRTCDATLHENPGSAPELKVAVRLLMAQAAQLDGNKPASAHDAEAGKKLLLALPYPPSRLLELSAKLE